MAAHRIHSNLVAKTQKSLFSISRADRVISQFTLKWNSTFNPPLRPVQAIHKSQKLNYTAVSIPFPESKSSFNPSTPKLGSISSTISFAKLGLQNQSSNSGSNSTKKIVGYWYLYTSFLVFSIVILGGVTRLTESGLSIVEWNLIKGMRPPSSQEEWDSEFEKLNSKMSIDEFKSIFWFEWAHRMLGRFIGLSFIIPGLIFAARGHLSRSLMIRSTVIAAGIGSQGILGWLMVSSGLSDDIVKNCQVPRVNHLWLSAHLGSAFILYTAMLTTALQILTPNQVVIPTALHKFKRLSILVTGLIFLTAVSGAWVAGLDAGLIYNQFPMMGTSLIPSDYWSLSTASETIVDVIPWYENMIKNPSAVQFMHRCLAMTTLVSVTSLFIYSRNRGLARNSERAIRIMAGVCFAQVGLGIATLLMYVPVPLAAAHQAGSLGLLTSATYLVHTLKRLPK